MKRGPDSAASYSNVKGLEMSGPPEKKRKTSEEPPEQLWDDNDDFTQDQLQNIDDIVASQVPATDAQFSGPGCQQSNGSSQRSHDYHGEQLQSGPQGQLSKAQRGRHSPNPLYMVDNSSLSPFTMGSRSEGYRTLTGASLTVQVPAAAAESKSTLKPSSAAQHAPQQTSSKGREGDNNFQTVLQKELEKTKQECEHFKREYQKVKDCQFTQDGQIKMLRTTLAAKESELAKYKLQKVQELDQEARERTQREKAQENEIERLKSQLQFKEREVVELKNSYQRKLAFEKKSNASDSQHSGNSQGTTTNNQRNRGDTQSPKPGKGGFPTKESFQGSQKPQKARNKQKSVDSPAQAPCVASDSTSTDVSTSCRLARSRGLTLGVRNPRGQVCGSKLVSQLMSFDGARTSESASTASTSTRELQGIVKLLEPPLQALDLSGLKFGRDRNMMLSPIASCRTQQSTASSSSSGSCSIDSNSMINFENYSLAQQTITALLQPSPCRNHGHPPELLGTDTTQALSLLPLVEDYVSRYIDMMHSTAEPLSETPSGSLQSWGGSIESSGETASSSVQSFMLGRASYANKLEDITLSALQVLDRVIGVSPAVRHALVCDKENGVHNLSSMFNPVEMDTEEAGTSRQADLVGNPFSAGQNNACSCCGFNISSLDGNLHRIVQDCRLMQKTLRLANPLHFNNRVGNSQIAAVCLSVLTQLASSCSTEEVEKFQPLVIQESLANCLLEDLNVPATDKFRLAHSALRLLNVLVRSENVVRSMCSQHESCLLSVIYRSSSYWSNQEKTDICKQMIQLLCSLISLHKMGPSFLLESNCHCSTQIIRKIILALYDALQSYHKEKNSDLLSLLRQGASLLCSLSQHDPLYLQHRHDVEHQYVFLVCGLEAAFKEANVPGEEVNLVYEQLWDFDQDYPESGGEEAEAELQSLENNNHKTDRSSVGEKAAVEVVELD